MGHALLAAGPAGSGNLSVGNGRSYGYATGNPTLRRPPAATMGNALLAAGPAGSGKVRVPGISRRSRGYYIGNPSLRRPPAATMGKAHPVISPAGCGKLGLIKEELMTAVKKFDCPIDMDVRELISLDDATEEVIDLGPNGCLIYYICMESPEDIYENLEKYFGDDSHEFDCFPDIKELISMDDDIEEKEIGLLPNGCLIYRMKNLEDTLDNCCHEQLENYFDDDSQEFDCFPGAVSWPALPRAPFASSPGYSQGAHRRITMPRVGVQAAPSASSRHRRSHNVVARALPRASFVSVPGTLDKDLVRLCLTRQENIIFYNFLERSEFCLNPESYNIETCKILGFSGTLMEYIIQETEKSHARAGRYKHQGEVPFFAEILLEPRFPVLEHHEGLDYGGVMSVNLNEMIWHCYFNKMLPQLVKKGTDGNNGLAAECDTKVLQAISKRVHFSMFLAEVKFREFPELFEKAITEQNIEKLRKLVNNAEIDELKMREENRTATFGLSDSPLKLKLQLACQIFDKYIVPLTIEAQVHYLLAKGMDGNPLSSGVRKIIRLKALSKSTQFLVTAAPSFLLFAKMGVILVLAIMFTIRSKIMEYLKGKGFLPDNAALAIWAVYLLSAKGVYDTLEKGKEVIELAIYYVKLLEKDKDKKP